MSSPLYLKPIVLEMESDVVQEPKMYILSHLNSVTVRNSILQLGMGLLPHSWVILSATRFCKLLPQPDKRTTIGIEKITFFSSKGISVSVVSYFAWYITYLLLSIEPY